ncbi:NAD-dependent epimerase/dehydratase family protein [Candidatus Bathyarchaeota archaeon]|nr:NAD-dependent epimerase/dehydratase family protein [Candidatus Bathyarchaeota archaeon]
MSSWWKDKFVVVTGGAGFIGSHTVDRLIELGANVTIVDNLMKGTLENVFEVWNKHNLNFEKKINDGRIVAGDHEFIFCDLEEKSMVRKIFRENDYDVVIHLAAVIGGRGYINTHPVECCRNFAINHNVFNEACAAGVRRIHYSSTACVYPVDLQAKYDSDYLLKEEDASKGGWACCDKEYGWAKFMGEIELLAYHKQFGLECSISRYVTAYGPREDDTHAIIALIRKAVEHRDPYVVWGSGEQDRDFTYVSDIVEGTLLAAEKITDGTVVNLGTSKRYKIKEVAFKILEIVGHKPKQVIFDKSKPEGVKSRALDISRAKRLLGWEPKVSLEEGLKRTVEWFMKARPKPVETLE